MENDKILHFGLSVSYYCGPQPVMDYQKSYFQERFPYLYLHMFGRPQIFYR